MPVVEYSSNGGSTWSNAAPRGAGDYKLRISAQAHALHEVTPLVVDFTINKVRITITADDKTATVGDKEPAYTYTVTGFATSETLATASTLTNDANMRVAGTYTITPGGAVAPATGNYETTITYVNGILTVSDVPTYTSACRPVPAAAAR